MVCNLDFLFAGIIILAAVFFKFASNYRDSRFSVTDLSAITLLVILSYFIDFYISSGMLRQMEAPFAEFAIAALLIVQNATFAAFCWHIADLTGGIQAHRIEISAIAALPCIANAILLLTNIQTHAVFTFSADTAFVLNGSLSFIPIICMAFYSMLAAAIAIVRRQSIRSSYTLCAILFAVVTLVALGVEFANPSVRLVTFTLALGLGILVSVELNPFEYVDSLTHAFDISALRREVSSLHHNHKRYSVVFISLDRLSELRVIIGTHATDELLRTCASTCRRVGRTRKVYRARSSIFAVFAYSHHEEERIVRKMEEFFANPNTIAGTSLSPHGRISVIGEASKLDYSSDANAYLEFITDRLHAGEIIDTDGDSTIEEFMRYRELRRYLARAIDDDLFEISFQPSWSLAEKRFCSAEVLSRLPHPTFGEINPNDFVAIAEKDGFITQLDRLQFVKTCKFIAKHGDTLKASGIDSLKFNLSPADLLDNDLGEWLIGVMDDHNVDPTFLHFEITETSAIQYGDELKQFVKSLTNHGISLVMDDFGSGYANYRTVLSLPFSAVKLDRSLLIDIASSEESRILYANIVTMLHELNFKVIAEGAETEAQAAPLRDLGVDEIQGFYYAKPLSEQDFLAMLTKEHANG